MVDPKLANKIRRGMKSSKDAAEARRKALEEERKLFELVYHGIYGLDGQIKDDVDEGAEEELFLMKERRNQEAREKQRLYKEKGGITNRALKKRHRDSILLASPPIVQPTLSDNEPPDQLYDPTRSEVSSITANTSALSLPFGNIFHK